MRITNYKLLLGCALILTITLTLSACTKSSDCFREDVFCAGLVTDTQGIEDNGMNQDAWVGLQNLENDGVVDQAAYIESVDARDYAKNIAYFAERGYDVIITSGIGLRDETLRGAELYAGIIFLGINQPTEKDEIRDNLIPINFPEDQMGFWAGALSARITKTGIVGAACENSDLDSMWRYCEGFRAGVKFTSKEARPLVIYRDDGDSEKLFLDEEWGRETASSMIERGADVIFAAGGITAQGAIRAAVESQVMAIGVERNQAAAMGESNTQVVTSIYGDAQFEVERILRGLKGVSINVEGRIPLKFIPLSPKFPETLTPEMQALAIGLWNGNVKTNVTTTKP